MAVVNGGEALQVVSPLCHQKHGLDHLKLIFWTGLFHCDDAQLCSRTCTAG